MRSFWHLEKGDFFDGIEECKEPFLRSAQRIELKKNDIVFFEGDAGGACFYVASGLLRIFCVTEAGKESTFFLRTAGEIFGLSEVLQDLPRKVNAQALAASVIFRLDRQAFDDLLSRNYALARRVLPLLGRRLPLLGGRPRAPPRAVPPTGGPPLPPPPPLSPSPPPRRRFSSATSPTTTVLAASDCHPFRMTPASMPTIMPSSSLLCPGIPCTTTSSTEVHMDAGKPP